MGTSILKKASGFLRRKGKYAAALAGVLAVTAAGYQMALPGFTLEREIICGLEEHVHTEACFPPLDPGAGEGSQPGEGGSTEGEEGITEKVLSCPFEGKEAHSHTETCYQTEMKLICGKEEGNNGHTHGDDCYITTRELTCSQEEAEGHTHDASCYQTSTNLTCGEEEREGHSHGEGCYDETGAVICGQEEGAGSHSHSDACYSSEDTLVCGQGEMAGHTHGEVCYTEKKELACGQEETEGHTHTEDCYEEESKLVCGKEEYNPGDHVHGDECYIEKPVAGGSTPEGGADTERQPICGLEEHTHSEACYGEEIMAIADNIVAQEEWWRLNNEGLLTITATEATTQIPDYASYGTNLPPWNSVKNQIKSVKVEGMTKIGAYAFYNCSQLEEVEVEISEGVSEIGNSAFSGCSALKMVKLPEGIGVIGSSAFSGCSVLEMVELPEGIKVIGERTFYNCGMLANISLPQSLEAIGDYAFAYCNLADIEIPGKVGTIGSCAFYGCKGLSSIHLPDSIETIGSSAFSGCSNLVSIDIPSKVTKIEFGTFNGCKKLTDVNLPDGIVEIGEKAFYYCDALTRISLSKEVAVIGERAFEHCIELNINLPESLTQIGNYAFYGCSKLTNAKIPEGITQIGAYTFWGCSSLEEVQLPDSLIQIGNNAFSYCRRLSAIELPGGVTSIGEGAFLTCEKLEEISFGKSVDSIGRNAFSGCSALESIDLRAGNLNPVQNVGITPANIRKVTVDCKSVDVLNGAVLSWWAAADVSFVGPGYFTVNAPMALGRPVRRELKPGDYYADEQGALYLLGDGKASLFYVPAGLEGYEVKGQIPAKEGGTGGWVVVSVERDALKMADGLKTLRFKSRGGIEALPDYSCGNCPTLESVEGESTVAKVRALFEAEGTEVSSLAFFNTGLEGGSLVTDNGGIEIVVGNKKLLDITTIKDKEAVGAGEGLVLYTGEKAVTTINLYGQLNETDYTMARCYFAFENGDGITRYGGGDPSGNYEFMLTDDKGNSYTVKARKAEEPFTYYYEIPRPKEGATMSFDIPSWYASPTSGGGKVKIWPSLLKDGGEGELDSGGKYHLASWVTKADEFPVGKEWYQGSKVTIQGDGKEEGKLYICSLAYRITMNRGGGTLEGNRGKDYMRSADFTDTLILPKEDGVRWRDGVLEAVEAGDVSWASWNSSEYAIYVNIENTPYLLCRLSKETEYKPPVVEEVDGEKTLKLRWRVSNSKTNAEITNKDVSISFGNEVIQVDIPEGGETAPDVYHIVNEVEAVQHFTHSGDALKSCQATAEVKVAEGNCTITKDADFKSISSGNRTWGVNYQYKISLNNSGSFPYTSLTKVYDDLSSFLYIRPVDMQAMFQEAEGMTGVESLEIRISNATLCSRGDTMGAEYYPGKEVTGTDGKKYTLTWQDTGVGTEYEAGVHVGTDPANPEIKELILLWEGEQGISLKIGPDAAPIPIKGAADIGGALDEAGYVVTSSAKYKVTWGLRNKGTDEDFILYSGHTKEFHIPVTVKDSFMLLDQDVLVKRSEEMFSLENNFAEALAEGNKNPEPGKMVHHSSNKNDRVYRDYILQKGVKRNSQAIDTKEDTVLPEDVLTYELQIDHRANPIRGIVPLVDRMRGAQALLVPIEANGHLATEYGLNETEVNGNQYYLLSKPGEYRGVTLGGLLTDSIAVTKKGNGLDTMIRWYLADIKETGQLTLNYDAYVVFAEGEEDVPSEGDGEENSEEDGKGFFTLSNESWLNDHQSHRLFSHVGLLGTNAVIEKMIVTSKGARPDEDVLEEYSAVGEGNTTLYRLKIENIGLPRVITGPEIYDILPPVLSEGKGFAWSKANVSISYYDAGDGAYTLKNGNNWDIVRDAEGRCRIVWGNDFHLWLKGEIYIYVTLTWPEGDAWEEYVKAYGASRLENTFWCYKLWDKVTHELAAGAEAYLQKGVEYIDGINSMKKDEQSRFYYTNKDAKEHKVTYYGVIYNSGYTRLYLNDLQDRLPRGFSYAQLYDYPYEMTNCSSICFTDADGNVITPKWVRTNYKIKRLGSDKIAIELFGDSGFKGYIQYDESHQKYYLAPGEAVAFSYDCSPGEYADTDDVATNSIAMPYYDPADKGVKAADIKAQGPAYSYDISLKNDGDCHVLTNQEAREKGFIGGEDGTQWLASDVDVKRGEIIPGITKRVVNVASENGAISNNGYANAADTINWAVTVTNSGRQALLDYTLTDAMEVPYGYTGMVKYEINYTQPTSNKISNNLFEITGCGIKEGGTYLTLKRLKNTDGGSGWTWKLNGKTIRTQEVEIHKGDVVSIEIDVKASATDYYNSLSWQYDVSLSDDGVSFFNDKGEEDLKGETELFIRCRSADMGIPGKGSATLSLSTQNSTNKYKNTTYVNKCYITPEIQQYDGELVSQGTNLEHHGKPSVRNRAWIQVVYGYTTSSEKKVEEVGKPENSAVSHEEKNYILLPEGDSLFRYTLTVDNTMANKKGMEKLVMIDSLPQAGDHNPFTQEEPRGSEFQVGLAEDPEFQVTIRNNGVKTVLPDSSYRLEYSSKTDFVEADWKGEETADWSSSMNPSEARSFRIVILDERGAGGSDLIPEGASVDVAFTGEVSSDGNGEAPMPGGTAWNGFGYRYKLKGVDSELESTPLNVGVRLPDVPKLVKVLKDKGGNAVKAEERTAFRFLVYQGGRLELEEEFTNKGLADLLASEGRGFTCIDVTVEKGVSQSGTVPLKDMVKWKWEDGTETGGWKPTEETWLWKDGEEYTVVELPLTEEGDYQFGSLGGIENNGYTFTHSDARGKEIIAVNLCEDSAAYELPETGGTGTRGHMLAGAACLMAAGTLLYRKRRGLRVSR